MKCARPEKGRRGLCAQRAWGAGRGDQLMRGGGASHMGSAAPPTTCPPIKVTWFVQLGLVKNLI